MEIKNKLITDEYTEEMKQEELSLNESIDLPDMRVSEISDKLELYETIYFDLVKPIVNTDEDNWRSASEIKVVSNGVDYEVYYMWLDQYDDIIATDPEFTFKTFEDLLNWLNNEYVNIVDLDEYVSGKLEEAIPMTRDELMDKEGTDNVELINAGRPEEERVELEEGRQPLYSTVIFYYYDENNTESVIKKHNIVPKDIRAEVNRLINDGAARVYVDAKDNSK